MYEHIVSLGWYCGTASAMSENGFRETSGPFDWMFSDLSAVLFYLDKHFVGFLDENQLEVISEKKFRNKKGLDFLHDCRSNLNSEIVQIREKYERRISKLLLYKNVCFIRAVRDQNEIAFIMENEDYIKRVIGDNDIIFLIPHFFYFKDVNFKWFSLDINVYQGNYKLGMTELFGRAPGLISYLKSNYPTEKQRNNQIFKMEKEKKDMSKRESEIEIRNVVEKQAISDVDNAYKAVNIKEEQCQNLARLIRTDLKKVDLPNEIEIYGMGLVGESFYYLIKNICMVKCFIDRNGGHFDLPVIRTNEYVWSGRKIIVTPTFFFEEIRKDLISAGVEENSIISLRDLLIEVIS